MASHMRAKLRLHHIDTAGHRNEPKYETLHFHAVAKSGGYPEDGSDEDNTFARFSPSASLQISIANPNLVGKFTTGETYYVDFSPVE